MDAINKVSIQSVILWGNSHVCCEKIPIPATIARLAIKPIRHPTIVKSKIRLVCTRLIKSLVIQLPINMEPDARTGREMRIVTTRLIDAMMQIKSNCPLEVSKTNIAV